MVKIKAFHGDKSKQSYMKWFKNLWSGTDESKITLQPIAAIKSIVIKPFGIIN